MATNSPMSNFNRKNPFVIQAKQKYNILMEKYELVSKEILSSGSTAIAIMIATLLVSIYFKNYRAFSISLYCIAAWGIYTYFLIKNTIKDNINSEIDKMVTLESNEIVNINIEYVQDLIYKIHDSIATATVYIKSYRWFNIFASVIMLNFLLNLLTEVV